MSYEPAIHVGDWGDPRTIEELGVDFSAVVDKYWVKTDKGEPRFLAHCLPARFKERAVAIATKRAQLKKEYDDSFKLVHELMNDAAREG